jgi:hypothetical protein
MDGIRSTATDTVTFVATPTAPDIRYANATSLAGRAEIGNTIRVYSGSSLVCTTLVATNGQFNCRPLTPNAQNGEVLTATSTLTTGGRTFVSPPSSVIVDTVAPPVPHVDPTPGDEVTGGGTEPGSTVVVTDDDGTVLCETEVDEDGNFVCRPLSPRPGDGDTIHVVVTDDSDNSTDPVDVVIDASSPQAPTVEDTDGSVIYGRAEPGTEIVIKDPAGNVLCETDADRRSGSFICTPEEPIRDGEELHVTATDSAGNTSPDAVVVVDQSGVPAPIISPTNGETVSGHGVPGATVTVRFPDGSTATASVRADGTWDVSAPPAYRPQDGDNVTATQSRPFNSGAAKVSRPATARVDRTAPDAPVVTPSDGSNTSGTGEPGATVIIRDSDGNVIGQTVVEGNGEWTANLQPRPAEGAMVTVEQVDTAGNTSGQASLRIGRIRIVVDVQLIRNGEVQTAHVYNLQPGERVTGIMYSDPLDLGALVADATGSAVFSFTIPAQITEGAHRIEATGPFSGKAMSGYFNVVAPDAPVVPQTVIVTPTVTKMATPTQIVTPQVYEVAKPAAHPPTGAEGMIPAAGTALGALLAGLFLILAAARRRREIEDGESAGTAKAGSIR